MKRFIALFFAFCGLGLSVRGQEPPAMTTDLLEEDVITIEAISLYPESVRRTIMEAAGYPDALIRIEEIQQNSQSTFQEIIDPFQQDVQEGFYELARYPALIKALVVGGKKSKGEIRNILQDFPEEIHDYALQLGRKRYQELLEIHQAQIEADRTFNYLLRKYPSEVRSKLQTLVDMPEVLDILMDQFRSTVMLGAMYKRNPDWIWHVTDSIQLEVAQRRAEELSSWQEQLEEDPEALKELESAADDFVKENGYDTQVYTSHPERYTPYWLYQNYTPYDYWFGYPYWYNRPFWYPHAYWYHWGFYYGPNGTIVVFDFPSWYFMDWYFYYGYHHYFYPHLTNCYLRYTARHPASTYASTRVVNEWRTSHRNSYSRDWLRDDDQRIDRIRNYGAREYQRQTMPGRAPSRGRNPVYVPPSRNPNQPSRTYRKPEAPRRVIQPSRQIRQRPARQIKPAPQPQRPQLDQARRHHAETLQKRKP